MMPMSLPAVCFSGYELLELTDSLRKHHRVVIDEEGHWVLLHYRDVVAVAENDEAFSSAVSQHLQIPNGLDGEIHTKYRQIVEKYLSPTAIQPYIPIFKQIADELIKQLLLDKCCFNAVDDLGAIFAVRAQCAWLGWPKDLETKLLQWMQENYAASRSKSTEVKRKVAEQFNELIYLALADANKKQVDIALDSKLQMPQSPTQGLLHDSICGRKLKKEEIVSILRNWTSGDLGSMALCIGVLVAALVFKQKKDTQALTRLKNLNATELEGWIDEVIRLDNPFASNRRIATRDSKINGLKIPVGTVVKLNWISANRDEQVFGKQRFCPMKHAQKNIVYGVGRHVCPGRTLSTWQLSIFLQSLLAQIDDIRLCECEKRPLVRQKAPVGGYKQVMVQLVGAH